MVPHCRNWACPIHPPHHRSSGHRCCGGLVQCSQRRGRELRSRSSLHFHHGRFRLQVLKVKLRNFALLVIFLTKSMLLRLLHPGCPDADHPDEENQQDDKDHSSSDAWGGFALETIFSRSKCFSHRRQCRQTLILIRNPLR